MSDKGRSKPEIAAKAMDTAASSNGASSGPKAGEKDGRDGGKAPDNSCEGRAQDAAPKFQNKRRTPAKPHIPPGKFPCTLRRADPRYWWGSVSSEDRPPTAAAPPTPLGPAASHHPNDSTSSLSSVSSASSAESTSSAATVEWVRPPNGEPAPGAK